MPEKCALSHGSGVLGRDPRDSCRFWSPHVENVRTVTQIRLGEGGGGGYHWGGGGVSASREPGSYICGEAVILQPLRTVQCRRLHVQSARLAGLSA